MKRDSQVFDLISEERNRQMHGIELIASENFVSDEVMEAMGSVLTTGQLDKNMRREYSAELAQRRLIESFKCRGRKSPTI